MWDGNPERRVELGHEVSTGELRSDTFSPSRPEVGKLVLSRAGW